MALNMQLWSRMLQKLSATQSPGQPSTISQQSQLITPKQPFRVRGISLEHDEAAVRDLLRDALDIGQSDHGLSIKSLAIDATNPREKVATINFESIPAKLLEHAKNNDPEAKYQSWQLSLATTISIGGESGDGRGSRYHHITIDTHFFGLTTLFSPPKEDHKVDIVAVTGLGGHALISFKDPGENYVWLRDSLRDDIPSARILVCGYDTHLSGSFSFQNLWTLGKQFCSDLEAMTEDDHQHLKPLVFIGHSLGGLIIKQAIIEMGKSQSRGKDILNSTYGALFFGVPNEGMNISSFLPIVEGQLNNFFIKSLWTEASVLREQNEQFQKTFSFSDSEIICYFETMASPTVRKTPDGKWARDGQPAILVGSASATHCRSWEKTDNLQPLNKPHSELVKFKRNDPDYNPVRNRLKRLVDKAGQMSVPRQHTSLEDAETKRSTVYNNFGPGKQWNNTGSGSQYSAQTQYFR